MTVRLRPTAILALILAASACGPTFSQNGGGLFGCGDTGDEPPVDTFLLSFGDEGSTAVVRHRGRAYTMRLYRGLSFEDEYRGDGARLTLDPEANLYLPGGERIGVCNRIDG